MLRPFKNNNFIIWTYTKISRKNNNNSNKESNFWSFKDATGSQIYHLGALFGNSLGITRVVHPDLASYQKSGKKLENTRAGIFGILYV